jgi:hypothetical protein
LLIRCEKKPQNYLALIQFAAVVIVWRLHRRLLAGCGKARREHEDLSA